MTTTREPLAPPQAARAQLVAWWDEHVAPLRTIGEQYAAIDAKLAEVEELARMLRRERAETVRIARAANGTWRGTVAELGRPESTLRSQMNLNR